MILVYAVLILFYIQLHVSAQVSQLGTAGGVGVIINAIESLEGDKTLVIAGKATKSFHNQTIIAGSEAPFVSLITNTGEYLHTVLFPVDSEKIDGILGLSVDQENKAIYVVGNHYTRVPSKQVVYFISKFTVQWNRLVLSWTRYSPFELDGVVFDSTNQVVVAVGENGDVQLNSGFITAFSDSGRQVYNVTHIEKAARSYKVIAKYNSTMYVIGGTSFLGIINSTGGMQAQLAMTNREVVSIAYDTESKIIFAAGRSRNSLIGAWIGAFTWTSSSNITQIWLQNVRAETTAGAYSILLHPRFSGALVSGTNGTQGFVALYSSNGVMVEWFEPVNCTRVNSMTIDFPNQRVLGACFLTPLSYSFINVMNFTSLPYATATPSVTPTSTPSVTSLSTRYETTSPSIASSESASYEPVTPSLTSASTSYETETPSVERIYHSSTLSVLSISTTTKRETTVSSVASLFVTSRTGLVGTAERSFSAPTYPVVVETSSSLSNQANTFVTIRTASAAQTASSNQFLYLIIIAIGIVATLIFVVLYLLRRKFKAYHNGKFDRKTKQGSSSNILTSSEAETTFFSENTLITQNQHNLNIPAYLEMKAEDFQMVKKIARGGGSDIYVGKIILTSSPYVGKKVIVKQLFNGPMQNMNETKAIAFKQEVAIMSLFQGSLYFASIIGFCTEPVVLVMKFYALGSLNTFLHDKGKGNGTKRVVLNVLNDVSNGLACLHSSGIAHCDMKPDNILLQQRNDGRICAVITDFGVSRVVESKVLTVMEFKTIELRALTPSYAAPEILRRQLSYGKHVKAGDLYSFGIVINETVTGRKPWLK